MTPLESYLVAMVPLLIATDPAMAVMVFLGFTEGLERSAKQKVLREAMITALVIGLAFIFVGAEVFVLLGITKADFEIGGGMILLVLSLADLVTGDKARRHRDEFVGIVPIGTPLIVGPAVLAALTVILNRDGVAITIAAFLSTLVVTAASLLAARRIGRVIGPGGLKAFSKIISIFLAAFAVHLVRLGIVDILSQTKGVLQ